jgi:hypothetical protein
VKVRLHPLLAFLAGVFIASSGSAAADEWHESYRAGLQAQRRGDHAAAVERFRAAIAGRPEPGRNVLTYGTNFEPRYYPYLRLAESLIALGQIDAARQALDTSAKWGREPADERQKLAARLPGSAPVPPATTAAPVATAAATATATAVPATESPAPTAASVAPTTVAAPTTPPPPTRASERAAEPSAPPAAARRDETIVGGLEILSQPPSATVYVDDEALGSTDPETGRLLKMLPSGVHRVRLSQAGRRDFTTAVEVPRGGTVTVKADLAPLEPESAPPSPSSGVSRAGMIAFAAVAVALILVTTWMAFRRPPAEAPKTSMSTPRPGEPTGGMTPPDLASPGVRRDASGAEWFGDYRLLSLLGRGGMASVYKAERRGETVALKRPLANFLGDPELMERFLREAEIGRTLNHPNIVRIVDRGRAEGVPYFAMELVPGETLQAFLRDFGTPEPRIAVSIVAQVAEALDFAHSKGVVHRDVKPSNIMHLPDGTAKVMDFGIARSQRLDGLTVTGAFLGTPHYAAPETIEGRGSDGRSDLYSLGVVFYELLTGRKPYVGDTPYTLLQKQVNEDAEPPSRLKPVPPALEAIVMRLLSRVPDERPASAEELVVALRDWLNAA